MNREILEELEAKSESSRLVKLLFQLSLGLAMFSIVYDVTVKQAIVEKMVNHELELRGILNFLHANFTGDVGNAFASIFGISLVAEVINSELQKHPSSREKTKRMSEKIVSVIPFVMVVLFLLGAIDAETKQAVIAWGTPDITDLTGAIYGSVVALISILKVRTMIFFNQRD